MVLGAIEGGNGSYMESHIISVVEARTELTNFELWSRAFIINGSISLPMAVMGYFILPDVPEITKSWYLSEEASRF